MPVDSAVKIEGEEKHGLEVKSSCEDLPPTNVGGGGTSFECNGGDGKDDYVFVNGSDVALDDHGEVEGNDVAPCQGKLEGGDQLDICNRKLNNGGELETETGVSVEEESEGGELVEVNGEIKSENENKIENDELADETGDGNSVDVNDRDLEVVEDSCLKLNGEIKSENENKIENDELADETGDGNSVDVNDRDLEVVEESCLKVNGEIKSENDNKIENDELADETGDGNSVDVNNRDLKVVEESCLKVNGEIQSESEEKIEDEEMAVERGDKNNVDSEVDDKDRDLGIVNERCVEVVADDDGGFGVVKGDDDNMSVGGICHPSLDDDDKNRMLLGVDGSDKVQNGIIVKEPELCVTDGEIEEQHHDGNENQTKQLEILENEEGKAEVGDPEEINNNVNSYIDENLVTETEPWDSVIDQSQPLGVDVSHISQEEGSTETPPSEGEFKAPNSGNKVFSVGDAPTEVQSANCEQLQLKPAESGNLVSGEAKAEPLGHESDPSRGSHDVNSLDSEVTVSELQENDEKKDASGLTRNLEECLENVNKMSEGADDQSNSELIESELDVEVLKSTVQSDEITSELMPEVKATLEMLAEDIQSCESHKPVIGHDLHIADGEGKAQLSIQMDDSLESSVASVVDNVPEETELVDVIDKKVLVEDANVEEAGTGEEATSQLILKSPDEAAFDDERKDQDDSHLEISVSGNEVAGPECARDSESCLRSEDGETAVPVGSEMDLPVPCDADITTEQGVEYGSYAADDCVSCSAIESSQPNMENSNHVLPCPVNGTEAVVKPVNDEADVVSKNSRDSVDILKPNISFGSFECTAPFLHNDHINIQADVLTRSNVSTTTKSDFSAELPKSIAGKANGFTFSKAEANGVHFTESSHKIGDGVVSSEKINTGEVSASAQEGSWADSVDGLDANPDLVRSPFYYLIRLPRFDDVKLSQQIKQKEIEVNKKTLERDAVRKVYREKKAAFWEMKSNYDTSKSEERAAYHLMTAKKREIESSQSLINLAKNAVTVEHVDGQILNLERKIQHETMSLTEEKKLIREIKQLNQQREHLAANTQRQQELYQAMGRRAETEERLKVLKKELDALKDSYSKACESSKAVKKPYDEQSALLNNLKVELSSLDNIRQEAYSQLQDLKQQALEKNKLFYGYKDDAKKAYAYAESGKLENLEQHCVNQVEKFMELWSKNEEFRKEYIKCNMKSTLRRFRTLDGRSLGPDEEPPSLVNGSDYRSNTSAKVNLTETVSLERDFPLIEKKVEEESSKKVVEQKIKPALVKNKGEPTTKNSLVEPSGKIEQEEKNDEQKLTKEEEEAARIAEERKRQQEAAELREKRRLEEKVKAQEALERKERMAKKAKARAEFKAKKEAEEKKK
ncbi:unnamed protein product, partial [Amaranthus hypochondriacus]